jgi:glycosyltransferase involved in cell wall biosynthesis
MENSKVRFIVIEPCNFVDEPIGGQLNFARILLDLYRDKIATVGYAHSSDEPIGVWFRKKTNAFDRDHFNLAYIPCRESRYWIPRRLKAFLHYRRHRRAIHEHPCKWFFIQEHAILMGFTRSSADSVCYRFPGVESQLSKSRFKWAIPLKRLFDFFFYRATRKADLLLASADDEAIADMKQNSFGFVRNRVVIQFPTRVDTRIFFRKPTAERYGPLRFVACGRLHWVKGWDLILDALALLAPELNFTFTYIGDGPDRDAFLTHADQVGLRNRVSLVGFMHPEKIAALLRESDLYLMGSRMEGWPTTLVEAYATGLPIVTTSVSGAREIVSDGINGRICLVREPKYFAGCIREVLALDPTAVLVAADPSRFSVESLRDDLERYWLSTH